MAESVAVNTSASGPQVEERYGFTSDRAEHGKLKYLRCVSGTTLNADREFLRSLGERLPDLQEVFSVEECAFILGFCTVSSRAGTDVKAALERLQGLSDTRAAVLVVLHHTPDPDCMVPDSSREVQRENPLTVDCLFYEDRGLLPCQRNQEALDKITVWIQAQVPGGVLDLLKGVAGKELKYLRCVSGTTLNADREFLRRLEERLPGLQEVFSVEECGFILGFCAVVSRAGTDVKAALERLQGLSDTRAAVLVVLHHTFDPYSVVPDSSRAVQRENTLTVDCLFHEDKGLLHCQRNLEALDKVTERIQQYLPVNFQLGDILRTLVRTGVPVFQDFGRMVFAWLISAIQRLFTQQDDEADDSFEDLHEEWTQLKEEEEQKKRAASAGINEATSSDSEGFVMLNELSDGKGDGDQSAETEAVPSVCVQSP